MAVRVTKYWSTNRSDPDDRWHDYDDCPPGSQIPWQNKQIGDNPPPGYTRCHVCRSMD